MKTLYLGEKNLGSLGIISIIESSYQTSSIVLKNIEKFIEEGPDEHYDIGIVDGKVLHTSPSHHLKRLSQQISFPVLLLVEDDQPWQKFLEQLDNVHGVIERESEVGFFLNAINIVRDGGYCYSWDIHSLKNNGAAMLNDEYYAAAGLTRRETEILKMYLDGSTNKEISIRLSRSEKTISAHKSNILRKLGVKRFSDLFFQCR
ncbi:helix-turn-helix transcriptional regulator [Enterobacillus tribolii]|uniref:DNA-binding NarL/FixJ family response regulator n=1 Tax=Enterobacillus tribolii TaxID=1487935 RepID=A0A370QGB4_9GAMM|nr:LuxR C-terminal-related transcriptional regulator [Enterobacillus tribolii]MBW7981723.1 response regulator transcription factor [Enterobacillus tribolii]RDK87407.1 DNA-binding NarL/FixJ family response regulator [Enterobacillus tribolii]